ncbi:DUF6314 family protein [Lacibacterium aquatile]|uniref:DUF6314 family protein n=1 Tax=Lacibacterium aquatile TaxID=1168082 RepID=A0ABW5DQ95_9PROT
MLWQKPATCFEGLPGSWTFERRIDNGARMEGTAVFTPRPDGWLHYREEGTLRLPDGQTFASYRSYLYAQRPNGFAVYFDEAPPRLFHEIALTPDLTGSAPHQCSADLYESDYRFLPDGSFTVVHQVRGPKKGYRMETTYRPA